MADSGQSHDQRGSRFRVALRTFGPFETAVREEWDSFQKQSGCDLRLEAVALDHHALYQELFEKQGLQCGDWDVAFVNTDWLAEAQRTKALRDLAPWLKADPPEDYPSGWTPSLLRFQQFGEATLGLPYHDGPECFIYRKDLFEDEAQRQAYRREFGVPLGIPETWDDFARTARFFTRPETGLWGTVFAAYPDGHNTVYDICLQLWSRGGELFDGDGAMRLDTPQMLESLAFYRAMLNDRAAVHPKARQFDSVQSGLAFARGEVAMMINWFGFASMCETTAESRVKGRVAVAAIPRGPGGSSVSLNVYWLLAVAAGSPHAELAYRFLRHAMSRANDRQRTLGGAIGCRKSTWNDAEVSRRIPFYGCMESLHAHARELPRLANWVTLSAAVDQMVLSAINTTEPIEAIVHEAQARAAVIQGRK